MILFLELLFTFNTPLVPQVLRSPDSTKNHPVTWNQNCQIDWRHRLLPYGQVLLWGCPREWEKLGINLHGFTRRNFISACRLFPEIRFRRISKCWNPWGSDFPEDGSFPEKAMNPPNSFHWKS